MKHKSFFISIAGLVIVSLSFFLQIQNTYALDNLGSAGSELEKAGAETGIGATSPQGDLPSMIGLAISFFLSLLGTIMFILMMYAGFLWMTAQDDEEKVKKAKDILSSSVIGFIVVISAYAITYLVQYRFQG